MVKITYAQECDGNSRKTMGNYFYVRTHSLDKFDFKGEWNLSNGATFTVYRAEYYYRPVSIEFWICVADEKAEEDRISIYSRDNVAAVEGKFRIIAEVNSKTYAPRLMKWWNAGDGSIEYAELCVKYLKPRVMQIPQFELEKFAQLKPQPTDAVLGGDSAFQKWLSTAAVLGGKHKN